MKRTTLGKNHPWRQCWEYRLERRRRLGRHAGIYGARLKEECHGASLKDFKPHIPEAWVLQAKL